jgi:hypothetical protein
MAFRQFEVSDTWVFDRPLAPGLSALDPYLPEEVTARSSLSTGFVNFFSTKWN